MREWRRVHGVTCPVRAKNVPNGKSQSMVSISRRCRDHAPEDARVTRIKVSQTLGDDQGFPRLRTIIDETLQKFQPGVHVAPRQTALQFVRAAFRLNRVT